MQLYHIALIGDTGAGKSTMIENLTNYQGKLSSNLAEGGTKTINEYAAAIDGYSLRIYDTPGFGDMTIPLNKLSEMFNQKFAGKQVRIIICFNATNFRVRAQTKNILQLLKNYFRNQSQFGSNISLAFTKADKIDDDERNQFQKYMVQAKVVLQKELKIKICYSFQSSKKNVANLKQEVVNFLKRSVPAQMKHVQKQVLKQQVRAVVEKSTGGGCFSLKSVIQSANGFIQIGTLEIGSQMYTWDASKKALVVDKVVTFIHRDEQNYYQFVELQFQGDKKTISLTPNHLIFLSDGKLVEAGELVIGDQVLRTPGLSQKIVFSGRKVQRGCVAPLTRSGVLVVGGCVASCHSNKLYKAHKQLGDLVTWVVRVGLLDLGLDKCGHNRYFRSLQRIGELLGISNYLL